MESLEFLANVLTLANIGAMLVGIIVGLIIGAIPGLGPPMAIALMIPISFNWPADTALILMVSTYAAGIYGGSFTAILLRAPGTSASAASAIEGYEMTKRGRATEAIHLCCNTHGARGERRTRSRGATKHCCTARVKSCSTNDCIGSRCGSCDRC